MIRVMKSASGYQIISARTRLKMSQKDFADATEVSIGTIKAMEKAENFESIDHFVSPKTVAKVTENAEKLLAAIGWQFTEHSVDRIKEKSGDQE